MIEETSAWGGHRQDFPSEPLLSAALTLGLPPFLPWRLLAFHVRVRGGKWAAVPISTDGGSEDNNFSRVWELIFFPVWEGVP